MNKRYGFRETTSVNDEVKNIQEVFNAAKAYVAFGHPREGSLRYHAAYERLEKAVLEADAHPVGGAISTRKYEDISYCLCNVDGCDESKDLHWHGSDGVWCCKYHYCDAPFPEEAKLLEKMGWRKKESSLGLGDVWCKYSRPFCLHLVKRAKETQWSNEWVIDLMTVRAQIESEKKK